MHTTHTHTHTYTPMQHSYKSTIDSKGLESSVAETILKEIGPNVLTPPPSVPDWLLFLLQFTGADLIYIPDYSVPNTLYS